MPEECLELKNIKYKTMLLSPNSVNPSVTKENILSIDDLVNHDLLVNEKTPWNKLNKGNKLIKINEYIETYSNVNNISDEEISSLTVLLHESLNNRMLQKAKDVIYDKNDGTIKNIPNLSFNKVSKKFTIKNSEKRISPLRSLAPKNKGKKTVKNKSDKNKNDKKERSKKTEKLLLNNNIN